MRVERMDLLLHLFAVITLIVNWFKPILGFTDDDINLACKPVYEANMSMCGELL